MLWFGDMCGSSSLGDFFFNLCLTTSCNPMDLHYAIHKLFWFCLCFPYVNHHELIIPKHQFESFTVEKPSTPLCSLSKLYSCPDISAEALRAHPHSVNTKEGRLLNRNAVRFSEQEWCSFETKPKKRKRKTSKLPTLLYLFMNLLERKPCIQHCQFIGALP